MLSMDRSSVVVEIMQCVVKTLTKTSSVSSSMRSMAVMAGVSLCTLRCTVQTTSERACSEEASMRGAIFVVEVKAKSRSHRDHDGILLMGLFASNNQPLPIFFCDVAILHSMKDHVVSV